MNEEQIKSLDWKNDEMEAMDVKRGWQFRSRFRIHTRDIPDSGRFLLRIKPNLMPRVELGHVVVIEGQDPGHAPIDKRKYPLNTFHDMEKLLSDAGGNLMRVEINGKGVSWRKALLDSTNGILVARKNSNQKPFTSVDIYGTFVVDGGRDHYFGLNSPNPLPIQ